MSRDRLDWTDATAAAAWLADLRERCDDAISVAEDQTAPIVERRLGRAEAKRLLAEAKASLAALLAVARRGLRRGAEPHMPSGPSASAVAPRRARRRAG